MQNKDNERSKKTEFLLRTENVLNINFIISFGLPTLLNNKPSLTHNGLKQQQCDISTIG